MSVSRGRRVVLFNGLVGVVPLGRSDGEVLARACTGVRIAGLRH
ncbi:hypothetical protein VB716_14360 [Synechococcus sp. CCY9201]|nr:MULTISPECIES: hypothetical protein [unclassified Synechococcus]MEA5423307.1 hypothetical protein [Synechococcus sp. CCY9202]MEA5475401.1 hypothetical protein [Synechococcus sp. CCY9201]